MLWNRLLKWVYIIFLIFKNVHAICRLDGLNVTCRAVNKMLEGRDVLTFYTISAQCERLPLNRSVRGFLYTDLSEAPFKQIRERLPLYRSVRGFLFTDPSDAPYKRIRGRLPLNKQIRQRLLYSLYRSVRGSL